MSTHSQTAAPDVDRGGDYRPATRLLHLATWVTNQAAMRAFQISSAVLAAETSHTRDYALLANLVEFGPGSQAELSRRTGIDRSDVVPALNAMEARGEVQRSVDPADLRRNIVTATDHGRNQSTASMQHSRPDRTSTSPSCPLRNNANSSNSSAASRASL